MRLIIENLKNKIEKDKKKLKTFNVFDRLLSILITLLNIGVIAIAIYTLVLLFNLRKEGQSDSVFYIIFALVLFMVISFFLNVFLEIYKQNTRLNEYKKIKNTLYYLSVKYKNQIISAEDLEFFVNILWEKANSKKKILIKDIIKDHLAKGH
ncbi:hypothetical protein [Mycoplasmopsis iners]|uniref:hypothetical protein n=1 Tax=Mycoplasmopsis iners TaxID=76630 RepID=UPI000494FBE4|nr:hypothetical protein [Mycoplasmopsis iners]